MKLFVFDIVLLVYIFLQGVNITQTYPLVLRLVASSVKIAEKAGEIIREVRETGNFGNVATTQQGPRTIADIRAQRLIESCLDKLFPDVTVHAEQTGVGDPNDAEKIEIDKLESELRGLLSVSDNKNVGVIGEEKLDVLDPNVESSLSALFQNVRVIGEKKLVVLDPNMLLSKFPEILKSVSANQITMWVDPLDGTSGYIEGLLDEVTVMIGIAVNGEPVAGVIHQPYYGYDTANQTWKTDIKGRTIWGIVDLGIGGTDNSTPPLEGTDNSTPPLEGTDNSTPPGKGQFIVAAGRFNTPEEDNLTKKAIDSLEYTGIKTVGGLGYKVLLMLEGTAHAYVNAGGRTKKWDTCAPEAILMAAGGKLTDIYGKPYEYSKDVGQNNSSGVLATASEAKHTTCKNRISKVLPKTINLE